jgi:predicted ABC-type ATPase
MKMNKALFLIGGPGSGKDFLIRTVLVETKIHEISLEKLHKAILEKKNIDEVNNGVSLIVNGNADDVEKILLTKQVLEAVEYETSMVYVYTTNDVSKQRNDDRIKSKSRTFNEEVRFDKYSRSVNNIKKFQEHFDSFTIFNNSYNINQIDEESKQEVLGWVNELQEVVGKFFSKSLDEEFESFIDESRGNEYYANQQLHHTSNTQQKKTGVSDYFSYQARKTQNAAKKPINVPLKPNTVAPKAHLAKEETTKGFKAFTAKHKVAAKPPTVQSDIRAGDGMSATSTLSLESKDIKPLKKSIIRIKESLSVKSPDVEFDTPEVYEDWGIPGEKGIYEGRSVSLNKPFKSVHGYSVYIKDDDGVNRIDFNKKKRITLQENLTIKDIVFWETL